MALLLLKLVLAIALAARTTLTLPLARPEGVYYTTTPPAAVAALSSCKRRCVLQRSSGGSPNGYGYDAAAAAAAAAAIPTPTTYVRTVSYAPTLAKARTFLGFNTSVALDCVTRDELEQLSAAIVVEAEKTGQRLTECGPAAAAQAFASCDDGKRVECAGGSNNAQNKLNQVTLLWIQNIVHQKWDSSFAGKANPFASDFQTQFGVTPTAWRDNAVPRARFTVDTCPAEAQVASASASPQCKSKTVAGLFAVDNAWAHNGYLARFGTDELIKLTAPLAKAQDQHQTACNKDTIASPACKEATAVLKKQLQEVQAFIAPAQQWVQNVEDVGKSVVAQLLPASVDPITNQDEQCRTTLSNQLKDTFGAAAKEAGAFIDQLQKGISAWLALLCDGTTPTA